MVFSSYLIGFLCQDNNIPEIILVFTILFVSYYDGDLLTEHSNGDGDYTSSLLGILVMQDVQLGLLVALLPALAGRRGATPPKGNSGVVHGILNGFDNGNHSGSQLLSNETLLCD